MSKKQTKKNIRNVVFCVLSFILALFLFVNSVCMLSVAFFLNENAWIDQMNSSNYFTDKADEHIRGNDFIIQLHQCFVHVYDIITMAEIETETRND